MGPAPELEKHTGACTSHSSLAVSLQGNTALRHRSAKGALPEQSQTAPSHQGEEEPSWHWDAQSLLGYRYRAAYISPKSS